MTFLAPTPGDWDPSQFTLQPDGTYRISIRGMAAIAGVDKGGLSRSLKSAVDENPLPLARSLAAQGFNPVDVSTWGETGGIPEVAAPSILEHYGINAASPSPQARAVLLAFSRVGINAYLKERLGVSQVQDTQASQLSKQQQGLEWLMSWGQRWGIKYDDRDMLQMKHYAMSLALPCSGEPESIYDDYPLSRLIFEEFKVQLPLGRLSEIGKKLTKLFRLAFRKNPVPHDQYVDGARRRVNHYPREWAIRELRKMYELDPSLFQRQ